jgi:hypothetical protein
VPNTVCVFLFFGGGGVGGISMEACIDGQMAVFCPLSNTRTVR